MTPDQAIDEFITRLSDSIAADTFVRLVFSNPAAGGDGPPKLLARRVNLKNAPHLSFTLRHATRDVTKNLPLPEGIAWVREQLGRRYRSALLGTTARDWQFIVSAAGTGRVVGHKPADTQPPPRTHDVPRQTLLGDSARDWLTGLGVLNESGKVRPATADKLGQINRYLEILSHLARDCGWCDGQKAAPNVSDVVLADMGCGKGYLTFGAWHLFCRVWNVPARVVGVETRGDLVEGSNRLARQIGAQSLEFTQGEIASAALPRADALVALHACNTATDDAIRRGIELGARLIVVAPCCHQEVRPQLGQPAPLAPVLRHGLMQERLAEWLTDGLRALFLEWAGYRAKIIEFVASEHTPKNLMIAAVRHTPPFTSVAARERIERLQSYFGLKHHALDSLLGGKPEAAPAG